MKLAQSNSKKDDTNNIIKQSKFISIIYSECPFVALGIQHANTHAPYCHLCPARFYNIFPHYLENSTIFFKKKQVIEHENVF